jgi:hypothetical protein
MFTSALAKVSRAEEQTGALEREIDAFFAEKTYEIRESFDAKTSWKEATFFVLREPPLRWAVIIGEIFHDLRSALDHSISDLTIAENGQPLEGTEFPIFESETDYFRLRSKGADKGKPAPGSGLYKIRGVSSQVQTTINWLQPFEVLKRKSGPSALSVLHLFNVIDKHRTIHIIRARADGGGWRALRPFGMPMNYVLPIGEIKDGAKIANRLAIDPNGEMDVEFEFKFFIAFSDNGEPKLAHLIGANIIDVCRQNVAGIRWIIGRLGGDTTTPSP